MRRRSKIFTRNGSKRRLKALVQKYSQEMAGKHCFREVMQKYSYPATHRGRIPVKKYYPGWCRNIHCKIDIHACGGGGGDDGNGDEHQTVLK